MRGEHSLLQSFYRCFGLVNSRNPIYITEYSSKWLKLVKTCIYFKIAQSDDNSYYNACGTLEPRDEFG